MHSKFIQPIWLGHVLGFSLGRLFTPVTFVALIALVFSLAGLAPTALGQTGTKLNPGDILYADSGTIGDGGALIKIDASSGQETVISAGGYLQLPFAPIVDPTGQVIVSDAGRLIRIDPITGRQKVLADNSRGQLGLPCGMAISRSGGVLIANLRSLIQVDPVNGRILTVSAGGNFVYPVGVAIAGNGQLLVLNLAFPSQIIRVNPQTGAQRVVTQGGYLKNPQAIAASGNDIYVTDVATADGSFGIGQIVHIDAQTGYQTPVSTGGYLVGPVGIAVDASGKLIVGDPYTVNPESPDIADGGYDGAIISINPVSGAQTLLARGQGSYLNPRGVALVANSRGGGR